MFQNERIALTIVFGWLFPRSDSGEVAARKNQFGEFDPGSGRTLAACLIHASRAEFILRGKLSGGRVSNT
ncbi:hypothetical protein D3C80_1422830 [compost metagenome]